MRLAEKLVWKGLIQSVNLDYSDRVYYFNVLGHKPSLLIRDVKISYTGYGSKS
jgi:hypothetical protein